MTQGVQPTPFIEDSVRGVFAAVRGTVVARPKTLVVVFTALAAVSFALSAAERLFDISGFISGGSIALIISQLMIYVLPRMWIVGLNYPVDEETLKAARNTLSEPVFGAAVIASLLLTVGAAPLVFLFWLSEDLPMVAFISVFVIGGLLLIRLGAAVLVVVPMAALEEDRKSPLIPLAWRLSKPGFGLLAQLFVIAVAVMAAVFVLWLWLSSQLALPLWLDDFVILPLSFAVQNTLPVLLSPAAYAVARHQADGYGVAEAHADLQEMLESAPPKEAGGAGRLFTGRR